MENHKKKINLELGIRLRNIRESLGLSQYDFSKALKVTEDHYRKIESGSTSLTLDKFRILYEKYHIEPGYLITGKSDGEQDIEYYMEKCNPDERDRIIDRFIEYMAAYVIK